MTNPLKKMNRWHWVALAVFIVYIVWFGTINSEVMKLVGADVDAKADADFNKDMNLKIGSRGVEVYRLQQLLKGAGQTIEVNGIFDRHTRTALNEVAGITSGSYNEAVKAIEAKANGKPANQPANAATKEANDVDE